jgi:hypothetical protein
MTPQDQIDEMTSALPSGYYYYYDLILISQIKHILQENMPLEHRSRFLELLAKKERGVITMAAVAAVQPAPDAALAMLGEMDHLSVSDRENIMRRHDVFAAHIRLNPSIMEAIKLCRDQSAPEYSA